MSVPDTNAFPPAPRRTSVRIPSEASAVSHASTRAWYISQVIAFRTSGRLKVSVASGPTVPKIVWDIGTTTDSCTVEYDR